MTRTVEGPTIGDDHLARRSSGLILLYGLTLLLVDFGRGWVLTYHENVFAGGAREFLRDGRWLIPRYLGQPLFEYPPLTQWLIALSMTIFGSDAEWVARLPIAIAGVFNAWLVGVVAARWHGDRIGRVAALIQLTTFYGLMQSRLAEADLIVTATVTAAMACLAFGVVDRDGGSKPSRWPAIGYFLATSLSFLAKGPIGPAFIALGSLAYACLDRRRAVWRFLLDPIGWGLLLSITLGWLAALYQGDPTMPRMMRENILDRFTTGRAMNTDGRENAFYYLYMVPLLLLPWTPWVVGGLAVGGRSKAFRAFLGCWFGAGLVLLSCSAFKHKHYAIPLLPPLSVIAACGLVRHASGRRPGRLAPRVAATLAILVALAIAVASRTQPGRESLMLWLAAMVATIGLGVAASFGFRLRGQADRSMAAVFASIWVVVVIFRSAILPGFDDYRDETALARRINARVEPGKPIYLVDTRRAQMSYYLRPPLIRQDDLGDFARLMDRKGVGESVYAIAPEVDLAEFARLGEVTVLERSSMHKRLTIMEVRKREPGVAALDRPGR